MSLSREARGLVDAARREAGGPTQEQRQRMRRGIMAAVGASAAAGATATSGTAAAAIATSPAVGIVAKIGVGAVMVALVGGGVALLSQNDETPAAPAVVTSMASAAPTAIESAASAPQTAEQLPAPAPTTSASAAAAVIARSATAKPAASEKNGGLAEELRLLTAARAAVAASNHSEALVSLDQYAARFPKGQLGYEASALRALALCGVGRKSEGRALAAAISEASPGSPVADRVTEACR